MQPDATIARTFVLYVPYAIPWICIKCHSGGDFGARQIYKKTPMCQSKIALEEHYIDASIKIMFKMCNITFGILVSDAALYVYLLV